MTALDWLAAALIAASLAGSVYQLVAAYAVRRFAAQPSSAPPSRPPVTILKPVCGADAGLAENLRSFCAQDYPAYQVVIGARSAADPAVAIARQVIAENQGADIALVVDERVYGANLKVSNLTNMMAAARHHVLVLADSDMRVSPGYLDAVVAALLEPQVGVATCLYAGRPAGGLWSRLGAMGINYGFLPSVLVGRMLGAEDGCFGATIAVRRETLARIGGFAALNDHLADDYAIGAGARRLGLRVGLCRYVVDAIVDEPSLTRLVAHELRWSRTIRSIAPFGYAMSAITYPIVTAVLALVVSGGGAAAAASFGAAAMARLTLIATAAQALRLKRADPWLMPLRDVMSFLVLAAGFCGRTVHWRGRRFRVDADGRLIALPGAGR